MHTSYGYIHISNKPGKTVDAYVYLKNEIFINAYLRKPDPPVPDTSRAHRQMGKFLS
jgi:hypothetical protein